MCGIFGGFQKGGIDSLQMREATDQMHRRGPDAKGYYESDDKQVFLGHRRLSILDVSEAANQPIYSACGRYVIVYNGEVYNFKELRQKLPGFQWKTEGDTEVVLELFVRYGPASFAWLNGIFACSIYEIGGSKIWLCRDQIGVKPLFVSISSGRLLFASELKSVVAALGGSFNHDNALKVSRTAVAQFLHLGFVPEPRTIFRGVKKFPAGNYACFDTASGSWTCTQYWSPRDYFLSTPYPDAEEAYSLYKQKVTAAVRAQMVSDVPLGTFLSGGIDSSLVTALAARASASKLKTFTIGMEDASADESVFAEKVARHLGTEHYTMKVKANDMLDLLPEFLSLYDEPFSDSSAFPTMLVSKLAGTQVKVVLSGDGGDELFQGYGSYQWAERLSKPGISLLRAPVALVSPIMNHRFQRAAKVFNHPGFDRIHSHIHSQEQYMFSEAEIKKMMVKSRGIDFKSLNHMVRKGSLRERHALWDLEHYLKDDLLVKVDRAGMYYSVETRVPLLDRDLVEFGLSLPVAYKVNAEYGTKYFMKRLLYEMVPREYFERSKRGFSIPLQQWLSKELRPLIDQHLNRQQVEYFGMIDFPSVDSVVKQFFAGKTYLYNRVWLLIVLHWWRKSVDR